MKRKLFLLSFSTVMSLMVWQMVIAKAPILTNDIVHYKMAYLAEPDTSKKDSLIVIETLEEPVNPRVFSRKYIPPRLEQKPKKVAKRKAKKERKSKGEVSLAVETETAPE